MLLKANYYGAHMVSNKSTKANCFQIGFALVTSFCPTEAGVTQASTPKNLSRDNILYFVQALMNLIILLEAIPVQQISKYSPKFEDSNLV